MLCQSIGRGGTPGRQVARAIARFKRAEELHSRDRIIDADLRRHARHDFNRRLIGE
jgi:hypothetical protein